METVIKCSLGSIWKCEGTDRTLLIREIDKRVVSVSQCVFNASVKLNHLLWTLFDGVEDVNEVEVPDVLDQTFIRQLMVGTEGARKEYPILKTFEETFPDYLPQPTYYKNTRNIYTHAAIQYRTNIMNHITTNFKQFQKRCYKVMVHELGGGKEEKMALLHATNNWTTSDCIYPMRKEVYDIVMQHRSILKCDGMIYDGWMKKNMANCIRYFVVLLRFLETMPKRRFTIAPLCQIGRRFITLDATTMEEIVCKVLKLSKTYQSHDWFNANSMVGKNREFTGTLSTDGISVCLHFKENKRRIQNLMMEEDLSQYDRILGVDPGRINIYSVVERKEDGTYEQRRFTRKQYYEESGIIKANKKSRKWNEVNQSIYDQLAVHDPKTASLERYEQYYEIIKQHYETLWYEKLKKKWAEQSLRLYGGKKRSFANFWKAYQSDKKTVLAYGASRFASSNKGEVACPTSRAYKEASDRFHSVLVNEFRTTKIHHECNEQLQYVRSQKHKKSIHGLHWCSSPNCCKFVDRDLNAAINILLNVMEKENRHEIFSRKSLKQLPPMTIGRKIKI